MKFVIYIAKKYYPYLLFLSLTFLLLWDFFTKGYLPIPGDIIVGHYYPWKDHVWHGMIAGYPIKNFQLSDVVTQLYPWRSFSIEAFRNWEFPLWNPYNLTGLPHLANLPTASLYPFNLLLLIFSNTYGWTFYLFLQTILSSSFMYLYLRELKISKLASAFGAVTFSFSSFMMMRYQYGIPGHTILWIPLSLMSIERYLKTGSNKWLYTGVFSNSMMLLAGYLQGMLYGYIIIFVYAFLSLVRQKKELWVFIAFIIVPFLVTAIQLLPFLDITLQSNRLGGFQDTQTVLQYMLTPMRFIGFLAPDFFGNPSTGNHWEKITYAEYAVYVGIPTIAFALVSLFSERSKNFYFWLAVLMISILFITNNPIARLPYNLGIPGFASLLPIRLTSVINISLPILAAYGLNSLEKSHKNKYLYKKYFLISCLLLLVFLFMWLYLERGGVWHFDTLVKNISVAKRNIILPTFYAAVLFLISFLLLKVNKTKYIKILLISLLLLTSFDLVRQAKKYNTFVPQEFIFPKTLSIDALQEISPPSRVMVDHPELITANLNLEYNIAMIDGYDSIHSTSLDNTFTAFNHDDLSEINNNPTRDLSFFNINSKAINIASPEFVFTFRDDLDGEQFELVVDEGRTKLYRNKFSYPRTYLTKNVIVENDNEKALMELITIAQNRELKAVVPYIIELSVEEINEFSYAKIIDYSPNEVLIKTSSNTDALLVFNDAFAKGWTVKINDNYDKIHQVNGVFRGVKTPPGENSLLFTYRPKSFTLGKWISFLTLFLIFIKVLNDKKNKKDSS